MSSTLLNREQIIETIFLLGRMWMERHSIDGSITQHQRYRIYRLHYDVSHNNIIKGMRRLITS